MQESGSLFILCNSIKTQIRGILLSVLASYFIDLIAHKKYNIKNCIFLFIQAGSNVKRLRSEVGKEFYILTLYDVVRKHSYITFKFLLTNTCPAILNVLMQHIACLGRFLCFKSSVMIVFSIYLFYWLMWVKFKWCPLTEWIL